MASALSTSVHTANGAKYKYENMLIVMLVQTTCCKAVKSEQMCTTVKIVPQMNVKAMCFLSLS